MVSVQIQDDVTETSLLEQYTAVDKNSLGGRFEPKVFVKHLQAVDKDLLVESPAIKVFISSCASLNR